MYASGRAGDVQGQFPLLFKLLSITTMNPSESKKLEQVTTFNRQ
jgi:hypothetical protein